MTALDICNRALEKLGLPAIASLDVPGSLVHELCKEKYPNARRQVLVSYPNRWDFAVRSVTLRREEDPVYVGGVPAGVPHVLPEDCVQLLWTSKRCELGWRRLYSFTETLDVKYVADVEDATLYPPVFCEAVATQLACWLCIPLGGHELQKRELFEECRKMCEEKEGGRK